jgi:hypothetical protein
MQKLHDKLYGSFIVVVKNYLKIAGVVVNIASLDHAPDLLASVPIASLKYGT